MLFLCATTVMAGCDHADPIDELDASARPSEVDAMLEILVMPPTHGSSNEAVGNGVAPPLLGNVISVAGNLPPKNVEPTDKLMIGWVRWAESLRRAHRGVSEPFEIDVHDEHSNSQYVAGGVMLANGVGHYALLQLRYLSVLDQRDVSVARRLSEAALVLRTR